MDGLNFNVFNLIIISGVLQGLIFSAVVLTQKKYRLNNTSYLGLIVLFLSLSNLQYWFFDIGFAHNFPIFKFIYIPWHWLVLPMFYLYVHKFLGYQTIAFKTKLHFILPFFIVFFIHVLNVTGIIPHHNDNKISSHFQRSIYVYLELLSIVFNIIIMILAYKIILKHESDKSFNLTWVKSETNWLKNLIYTGLAICLLWLVALLVIVIYNFKQSYVFYPLWIGISVLVYWIGYTGINKSQQLKERIEIRKKRILDFNKESILKSKEQKSKSFGKIENHIVTHKSYLDPNFSLKILSQQLNLSEGYVSQLINKNSDLNFNDYINAVRVNEAKAMLTNMEYDNYTILTIGLEAGFNSKSSFYTAFKKFTGKTPVAYKKSVRNL